MHRHCGNPGCPNESKSRGSFTTCKDCTWRWIMGAVPVIGYVPHGALRVVAEDFLQYLKPTPAEVKEMIMHCRGPRHREGPWDDRPVYSYTVVNTRYPRVKASRRLPHLLIGRRFPPNINAILAALTHYWIGRHHLDGFEAYDRYLVGTTYMMRRALMRPPGTTGSYRGEDTKHNYFPDVNDFGVIGTHLLKGSRKILGITADHGQWMAVRYLRGVESGEFPRPCIVPPDVMHTSASGDHVFDHVLSCRLPHAPEWQRGLRRHSGFIRGRYPDNLDVPLRERPNLNQARYEAQQVKRMPPPDTEWLFT